MTEMRRLLLILSVFALTAQAQEAEVDQSLPWQQVWQEVMSADEMEDEDWEENYERLAQLTEQPLDLNQMTVAEMEQLPFLSAQQVEDIVEYLDRYGPMRSMNELKSLSSTFPFVNSFTTVTLDFIGFSFPDKFNIPN